MANFLSNLTAVGIAREATYGSFATSSLWLPVKDVNIEKNPNVILPKLMRQNRGENSVALAGIRAIAGNIVAPLFPDAGMLLMAGAIGLDSTNGSSPSLATTLASLATAGANTISTTAGGFALNDIIQIDSAASGLAECHKVLSISGTGPFTVTLAAGETLLRGHANGASVSKVVSPFTHTLNPAATLPSFSVEKNMNGMDIQYSGLILNKMDLKLATNAEAEVTYAFEGQQDQVIGSPAVPAWPADVPFGPTGITASLGGASDLTVSNVSVALDNTAKGYPTFNGQSYRNIVVPTTRKVSMKFTAFLQALAGGAPAAGYFADLAAAPSRALSVAITSGSNSATFAAAAAVLTKYSNPVRLGDLVMSDLEYDVLITGANLFDLTCAVINTNYLTYC